MHLFEKLNLAGASIEEFDLSGRRRRLFAGAETLAHQRSRMFGVGEILLGEIVDTNAAWIALNEAWKLEARFGVLGGDWRTFGSECSPKT